MPVVDTPKILGGPPAKSYPDAKADDAALAPRGVETFTLHLMRWGEQGAPNQIQKFLERIREMRLVWLLM